MSTTIVTERQWTVNNPRCKDPIYIYRTTLRSDYTGKIIPGSAVYSVEYNKEGKL